MRPYEPCLGITARDPRPESEPSRAGQLRLFLVGLCATLAACAGPPPVAAPDRATVHTVEVSQPESEVEELTTDEEYRALAELLQRPATEQVAEWRKWAQGHSSVRLRAHALAHLAWVEDAAALELATEAISSSSLEVQAQAARVLTHIGLPRAASARAPLQAVLDEGSDEVVAELVWALVVLEEPRVFARAMQLYQRDRFSDLTRLDGGPAFDPRQLARSGRNCFLSALVSSRRIS